MSHWQGFQRDLLRGASLNDSDLNITFLTDWASAASSSCRNNPVDLSHTSSRSSSCHRLTASRVAQAYRTREAAIQAFDRQIHSGNFRHLLAAIESGSPYTYTDQAGVAADLKKWGSVKVAAFFEPAPPSSGGGGGTTGGAASEPHVHKGWQDMRRSLNRRMPAALDKAQTLTNQALRVTGRAGKVRL